MIIQQKYNEETLNEKKNVLTEIVSKNLCIGCGVCVAMCPNKALVIKKTDYGEYKPYSVQNCLKKCKICLQVCPFYHNNISENEIGLKTFGQSSSIKFSHTLGYYFNTYVGYVQNEEKRKKSSSGGLATWFLTELIRNEIVDYVVCVSQFQDSMIFRFEICKTIEEIISCSGSNYCPVESSSVLSEIKKKPGRYAFTGLPCQLKSLRLATEHNKILRESIIMFVGLTCGQLKTMNYTCYLKALSGVSDKQIKIKYREKISGVPVNNFCFTTINRAGERSQLFFGDGPHEAWTNKWFTPNPCNYCDDIFAEVADVSFMDAWLPEYMRNEAGTNILIVRSIVAKDIFQKGLNENVIHIEDIGPDKVLQSQEGVVLNKRKQLAYRLYLLKREYGISLNKRVMPKRTFNLLIIYENFLKEKMRVLSQDSFLRHYDNTNCTLNLEKFNSELRPALYKVNVLNILKKIIIIKRVFAKFKKMLSFSFNKNP